MTYTVVEIFSSLQGEGIDVGKECTFIRFSGCNLNCVWCDTDWTKGKLMTEEELLAEVKRLGKNYIVLTGGEPTIQKNIVRLTNELNNLGYEVGIETNGVLFKEGMHLDTMAISPKLTSSGFPFKEHDELEKSFWEYPAFLKFVIMDETDMLESRNIVYLLRENYNEKITVYFQPVFGEANFLELPDLFHKVYYDQRDLEVRFLPQVHKLIGVK